MSRHATDAVCRRGTATDGGNGGGVIFRAEHGGAGDEGVRAGCDAERGGLRVHAAIDFQA